MGNRTIFYRRKAVRSSEIVTLEDRLDNYKVNMVLLVDKIRNEVSKTNKAK